MGGLTRAALLGRCVSVSPLPLERGWYLLGQSETRLSIHCNLEESSLQTYDNRSFSVVLHVCEP